MNRLFRWADFRLFPTRPSSAGLSIIQMVGCIAAITAGVVVGALFLDIDLKAAWQLGLENVGVAAPKENPSGGAAPAGSPTGQTATGDKEPATLVYWVRLREIIQTEQAIRAHGELQAAGDVRAVMYARTDAFGQAAEAIEGIATEGVDAEAVQLAAELANWYQQAVELSKEGTRLDEADLASSAGPQGRRWHSAQRQQREQFDLLTRKTTSLQGKLTARYKKKFPDLR